MRGSASAGGGEIVQVQGGHIIRATGRKDRHSKVYTAKGPRDRRVRLSAPTAIQFYDVQDRLGYDRPSKALDWLIAKAKSAIDKLAELPPFDPAAAEAANAEAATADLAAPSAGERSVPSGYEIPVGLQNPVGFHGFPHRDLCLSLRSFQNPGLIDGQSGTENPNSGQTLFGHFEPGSSGGGRGGAAWPPETGLSEMGRFSRLLAWSGGSADEYGGQASFRPPAPFRGWDEGSDQQQSSMAGIGVLGSEGFMGFSVPTAMQGGGGDVHEINNAAHHNYSRASSMSTDSSR